MTLTPRPAVTVCVTTRDRSARVARLLRALEGQSLPLDAFEVVVADDGSHDDTAAVLEATATTSPLQLRSVRSPVPGGPAAGRNRAWRLAAAPLVAFTDDDCVPTPDWLRLHVEALEHADISQGPVQPDPAQQHLRGPFSRQIGVPDENGLYETCNIAYRRAWLERVQGFDERFRRSGEDADLAWRAKELGARTTFVPGALVLHDVEPSSWRRAVRDTLRWGGVVELVARHPHLRSRFGRGPTWRAAHLPAALALCGAALAGAGVAGRRLGAALTGAALTVPYGRHRLWVEPVAGPRRERLRLLLPALAVDLAELAVIVGARGRLRLRRRTRHAQPGAGGETEATMADDARRPGPSL